MSSWDKWAAQNYAQPSNQMGSGTALDGINPNDLLASLGQFQSNAGTPSWMGSAPDTSSLSQFRPGLNGPGFEAGGGSMWDRFSNSGFFGKTDTNTGIKTDGWGGAAISGAKGLFDAFNSYKSGKLAEKSFKLSKEVAQANLTGAKQSYNTALRDKRADAFGNADADEYMKTNRMA